MKREEIPIEKITLNLFEGDYAFLRNWYSTRVGAGKIIRELVRAKRLQLEAELERRAPIMKGPDL